MLNQAAAMSSKFPTLCWQITNSVWDVAQGYLRQMKVQCALHVPCNLRILQKSGRCWICRPWELATVCLIADRRFVIRFTKLPWRPISHHHCRVSRAAEGQKRLPTPCAPNQGLELMHWMQQGNDALQKTAPILHARHSQQSWRSCQKHTFIPNSLRFCQKSWYIAWKGRAKFQVIRSCYIAWKSLQSSRKLGQKVKNCEFLPIRSKRRWKRGIYMSHFHGIPAIQPLR